MLDPLVQNDPWYIARMQESLGQAREPGGFYYDPKVGMLRPWIGGEGTKGEAARKPPISTSGKKMTRPVGTVLVPGHLDGKGDILAWARENYEPLFKSWAILADLFPMEVLNVIARRFHVLAQQWPWVASRIEWIIADDSLGNSPSALTEPSADLVLNGKWLADPAEMETTAAKLIADGQAVCGSDYFDAQVTYAFAVCMYHYFMEDSADDVACLPVFTGDQFGIVGPTVRLFLEANRNHLASLSQRAAASPIAAFADAVVSAYHDPEAKSHETGQRTLALMRLLQALPWTAKSEAIPIEEVPDGVRDEWFQAIAAYRADAGIPDAEVSTPYYYPEDGIGERDAFSAQNFSGRYLTIGADTEPVKAASLAILGAELDPVEWGMIAGAPNGSIVRVRVCENVHAEHARNRYYFYRRRRASTITDDDAGSMDPNAYDGWHNQEAARRAVGEDGWIKELVITVFNPGLFQRPMVRVVRVNNRGSVEIVNDSLHLAEGVDSRLPGAIYHHQVMHLLALGLPIREIATMSTDRTVYPLALLGFDAPIEDADYLEMPRVMANYCERHRLQSLSHLLAERYVAGLDTAEWLKQQGYGRFMVFPVDRGAGNLSVSAQRHFAAARGMDAGLRLVRADMPEAFPFEPRWNQDAHRSPIDREWFNGRFAVAIVPQWQGRLGPWAQEHLGRELKQHEWGELVGAPDGALVIVSYTGAGVLLRVRHQYYDGEQVCELSGPPGRVYLHIQRHYLTGWAQALAADNPEAIEEPVVPAPEGFGLHVLAHTLAALANFSLHICDLRVNAAGCAGSAFAGYYTWARLGWNAPLSPENLKAMPPAIARLTSFLQIEDLSLLMAHSALYPELSEWWRENGTGGVFSLGLDASENRWLSILWRWLDGQGVAIDQDAASRQQVVKPDAWPKITETPIGVMADELVSLTPDSDAALTSNWELASGEADIFLVEVSDDSISA